MTQWQKRIQIGLILLMALAALVVWYAVFYFEAHQDARITFFDVGQGDAIFIELPNGMQVLVDGGHSSLVLARLGRILPFWDRSLDIMVLTHPHADHLTGLVEVLKRYEVRMVVESGVAYALADYDEWRRVLREHGVRRVIAERDMRIQLSPLAHLDVLSPRRLFTEIASRNVHDAMVTTLLTYGSSTVLLMGDAERGVERELMAEGVISDVDVLKVGHHGSKTSSSDAFLAAAAPEYAVISVGKRNRYGHPHGEVMDRLKSRGIELLRTDQEGTITFTSNGREIFPVDAGCFFWCGVIPSK